MRTDTQRDIVRYQRYIRAINLYHECIEKDMPMKQVYKTVNGKCGFDHARIIYLVGKGVEHYRRKKKIALEIPEKEPLRLEYTENGVDVYKSGELLKEGLTPYEARQFADLQNGYVPKLKKWDEDTRKRASDYFGLLI